MTNQIHHLLKKIAIWLQDIDSSATYRYSETNISKYAALTAEDQKVFNENCKNDKYEVNNLCKSGALIFEELYLYIMKLPSSEAKEKLEEYHGYMKELPNKLFNFYFLPNPNSYKKKAKEYIQSALCKNNESILVIRNLLMKF